MKNEKSKLSDEKYEEVEHIFNEFDKNKNGTICVSELAEALRILGFRARENEISDFIKEFDKDESGHLNFEEFLHIVNNQLNENASEEFLAEAFKVIDMNGDGIIPCNDLVNLLTFVGPKLTMEEVNEILKEIDPKGEGFIRWSDLLKNKPIK